MPLAEVVANNIRRRAERKGLALTVLADLAGVSRAHLFSFLAGEKDVTLGWLERLATALEVDPVELVKAPTRK